MEDRDPALFSDYHGEPYVFIEAHLPGMGPFYIFSREDKPVGSVFKRVVVIG